MTTEIIAIKREKPILFNGDMVRAVLDGRKTQTRRVIKDQPIPNHRGRFNFTQYTDDEGIESFWQNAPLWHTRCPFGKVGDQLWVRETFFAYGRWATRFSEKKKRNEWHFIDMTIECDKAYKYDADNHNLTSPPSRLGTLTGWYKRPAIFMSRHVSRIQLEITGIRVERLQDISDEDVVAEGSQPIGCDHIRRSCEEIGCYGNTAKAAFRGIWESTGGDWNANPWVWVIEFKRVEVQP